MSAKYILPEKYKELTILNMEIESCGYTVPWNLLVCTDGQMFMHLQTEVHKHGGGAVQMKFVKMQETIHVFEKSISKRKFNFVNDSEELARSNWHLPVLLV